MLFLFLKNGKDSSYSSVILFDSGTGHTYNKIQLSHLGAKDEGHRKRLLVMFVKITKL